MCMRVGGKNGLSFLSSLSQVVILSDYFRGFFSEVLATGLHEGHSLPFLHLTVKGEVGPNIEEEGLETRM